MEELELKAIKAVEKYLECRNYDVMSVVPDRKVQIVAIDKDDDSLCFIHVYLSENYFCESKDDEVGNDDYEQAMFEYVAQQGKILDSVDEQILRCDKIAIHIIAEHKALLRHHMNVNRA